MNKHTIYMKSTYKWILMMSLLSLLQTACCAPKDVPIEKFSFNHDGTRGGDSFEWSIKREADGAIRFTNRNYIYEEYNFSKTMPTSFMDSLEAICRQYKVYRWDGFRKHNRLVCDGTGFSLNIRYANGKTVEAHGMNRFPKNYSSFRDDLYQLCRPVVEQFKEAKKTENDKK